MPVDSFLSQHILYRYAPLEHQANIILTDEEIKQTPSVYTPLIPGAGSGNIIILQSGLLLWKLIAPYTNVSTSTTIGFGAIIFVYGDWDDDALPYWNSGPQTGTLNSQISDGRYLLFGSPIYRPGNFDLTYANPYPFDAADTDNAPIKLAVINRDGGGLMGDFEDGDPNNEANISLGFKVYNRSFAKCLTTAETGWNPINRTFGNPII